MGGECSAYGERISTNGVLVGNLRERDHLGDQVADGRMLFRLIFRKWYVGYGLDRAGLG